MDENNTTESKRSHPHCQICQIAERPTHKLLLKKWLKTEEVIFGRVSLKETQIELVRREITMLYMFFFMFYSIALVLLFKFNASTKDLEGAACKRWWIPSVFSMLFSLVIIWALRYKNEIEADLEKSLKREKEDRMLLSKSLEELKRKGDEFNLLNEMDARKRAKSMRVEAEGVRKCSAKDFMTLFFFSASCVVIGIIRIVLCN